MTFFKATLSVLICFLLINLSYTVKGVATTNTRQADLFSNLKGYKRDRALVTNSGKLLGYIYVNQSTKFKNSALLDMVVVKANGTRLETLYRINEKGFFNAKGKQELNNMTGHYYGFKLFKERKAYRDNFAIGFCDKKGSLDSDDNNFFIDWDYKKNVFRYEPMP